MGGIPPGVVAVRSDGEGDGLRSRVCRSLAALLACLLCVGVLGGCGVGGRASSTQTVERTPIAGPGRDTEPTEASVRTPAPSVAVQPGTGGDMEDLQECILGRWLHSHEEDTPEVAVYRPAEYAFPPSRGRMGYEFQEGGGLVYIGIARGDGSEESIGRWTLDEPGSITIETGAERVQPVVLKVSSCDAETLKVEKS